MHMTNTATIAEAALRRLNINFRYFPCRNGRFYFCEPPSGGLSFDLQFNEDSNIKLWRFVGAAHPSKAGKRIEYRKPECPHSAIGLKVTDDGDVCLYAEQLLDPDDFQKEKRIIQMIKGYLELINLFSSQKSVCKLSVDGVFRGEEYNHVIKLRGES